MVIVLSGRGAAFTKENCKTTIYDFLLNFKFPICFYILSVKEFLFVAIIPYVSKEILIGRV